MSTEQTTQTTEAQTTSHAADVQPTETRTIEVEVCSRCGGTGHYSYCSMYGTTCFRCHGKKQTLTKRGAVAQNYLTELRSKPASELKVGDRIFDNVYGKWFTITEVRPGDADRDGGVVINGQVVPSELIVVANGHRWHTSAKAMFRVAQSKDELARTLKLALDFQDTLTKTGTVRKAKGKK